MVLTIEVTPATKRLTCAADQCKNTFQNKKNIEKHMEKFHQKVTLLSQSPFASAVWTLFNGESTEDITQPSTQGTSDGRVNSPKIRSEGTFICSECSVQFPIKDNLITHMNNEHDKAKAAPTNDTSQASNGEDEEEIERQITEIAEDLEMEGVAKTVEEEVRNMVMMDKIVDSFVDNAYNTMNASEGTEKTKCPECHLKDQVIDEFGRLIDVKEASIVEKTATVNGLGQQIAKLSKENVEIKKKLNETDKLKEIIATKTKEISNLKVQIDTKDKLLAMAKVPTDEVVVEAVLKKCNKFPFTAATMGVIGLHMENDHQYQYECEECQKKFPFKNQLKLHKREIHDEGTFSCFVCTQKFKTHKQLKAHIQKKCKDEIPRKQAKQIVHKKNDDILTEDEHKCPQCPKITNNQMSLVNHLNTVHRITKEKCDTCGVEFAKREDLVHHLVESHTDQGIHNQQTAQQQAGRPQEGGLQGEHQGGLQGGLQGGPQGAQQGGPPGSMQGRPQQHHGQGGQHHQGNNSTVQWLPRLKCQICGYETNTHNELDFHTQSVHKQNPNIYMCKRCYIEVKENHICRLPNDDPQNTCNFCKVEFFSKEDKLSHECDHHPYKTVIQQRKERKRANTKCSNGVECWRAARNKCWFKHSQQVNSLPHQGHWKWLGKHSQPLNILPHQGQGEDRQATSTRPPLYCKYQETCFKGMACKFKHFQGDFLQNQHPLNQQ